MVKGATARLLELLRMGAGRAGQYKRAGPMWSEILKLDSEDRTLQLRAFAELMSLPSRAREEIQGALGDAEIYVRALTTVEAAFARASLHAGWSEVANQITEGVFVDLERTVYDLGVASPRQELQESVLADLLKELDDLRTVVFNLVGSRDLKALLLAHIEEMRLALLVYRLRGAEGVAEEVNRSIGMMMRHGFLPEEGDRSEVATIKEQFMVLLMRIHIAVTTADKLVDLAAPLARFLGMARDGASPDHQVGPGNP